MKRICCLLLVIGLLPLVACGQSAEEPITNETVSTVSTAVSTTTTTTMVEDTTETTTTTTEAETTTTSVTTTTITTIVTTTTTTEPYIPTTTTTTKPAKEWELYWSDEFDGNALDETKWNVELGTTSAVVKKRDNVTVEDGNCVITLRRDNPKDGYQYSSAYVTTAYKFSFCFGRLEFRAKLPVGQGVWPALWTLGDNYLSIANDELGWPLCGEIDVMELVGSSNPSNPFDNKTIMNTLHWGPDRNHHEQAHKKVLLRESAAKDYHIYAIEWDIDAIVWFVDDQEYLRVPLTDPDMGTAFLQKHWIIMNINLCDWGTNCYNETTPDEQSMYVDYVRVYKEKK